MYYECHGPVVTEFALVQKVACLIPNRAVSEKSPAVNGYLIQI